MKTILFVGDKPSYQNWRQDVAFIGTQSYQILMKWVNTMQTLDFRMINSNSAADISKILSHRGPIVALGNIASIRMTRLGVPHFKLPHPSGRNRMLNDKEAIQNRLFECVSWLSKSEVL